MKILLAIDGSPCSDAAVEEVGRRPWPEGSAVKVLTSYELPVPPQPEGWILPANYFEKTKAEYKLRRDTIVKRFNNMPGVFCPAPGGAFYVMAKLPVDDADTFCQWLLEDFSYNNKTVMLAPATGFYKTPDLGKNEVRLAYVLGAEAINSAMDCLEKALEQYPGKVI